MPGCLAGRAGGLGSTEGPASRVGRVERRCAGCGCSALCRWASRASSSSTSGSRPAADAAPPPMSSPSRKPSASAPQLPTWRFWASLLRPPPLCLCSAPGPGPSTLWGLEARPGPDPCSCCRIAAAKPSRSSSRSSDAGPPGCIPEEDLLSPTKPGRSWSNCLNCPPPPCFAAAPFLTLCRAGDRLGACSSGCLAPLLFSPSIKAAISACNSSSSAICRRLAEAESIMVPDASPGKASTPLRGCWGVLLEGTELAKSSSSAWAASRSKAPPSVPPSTSLRLLASRLLASPPPPSSRRREAGKAAALLPPVPCWGLRFSTARA